MNVLDALCRFFLEVTMLLRALSLFPSMGKPYLGGEASIRSLIVVGLTTLCVGVAVLFCEVWKGSPPKTAWQHLSFGGEVVQVVEFLAPVAKRITRGRQR